MSLWFAVAHIMAPQARRALRYSYVCHRVGSVCLHVYKPIIYGRISSSSSTFSFFQFPPLTQLKSEIEPYLALLTKMLKLSVQCSCCCQFWKVIKSVFLHLHTHIYFIIIALFILKHLIVLCLSAYVAAEAIKRGATTLQHAEIYGSIWFSFLIFVQIHEWRVKGGSVWYYHELFEWLYDAVCRFLMLMLKRGWRYSFLVWPL